jgi:hypothetical protein
MMRCESCGDRCWVQQTEYLPAEKAASIPKSASLSCDVQAISTLPFSLPSLTLKNISSSSGAHRKSGQAPAEGFEEESLRQ